MIRQCFLAKTGIQFHRDSFKEVGLEPSTLYPDWDKLRETEFKVSGHDAEPTDATLTDKSHGSLPAPSEDELLDAKCKIYDQLKLAKGCLWWILEILPLRYVIYFFSRFYLCHSIRARLFVFLRMHLGRPRKFSELIREKEEIYVHRSVKIRMEAEGLEGGKYKPKAKFEDLDYYWVD